MNISIIGAGNLAINLTIALEAAGHNIIQICSRTLQHAMSLSCRVNAFATNRLDAINDKSDIYIVAVADKVLPAIISKLSVLVPNKIILHTSGVTPLNILENNKYNIGVFYPLQTFSKKKILDFSNLPICLEAANKGTLEKILSLAYSISSNVHIVNSEQRKYLHFAAVWACNFVNHCYFKASEILNEHGLPFDIILPLIDETASKVHKLSPFEAQTGPASRLDFDTITKHLELMANDENNKLIYKQLTYSIQETIK